MITKLNESTYIHIYIVYHAVSYGNLTHILNYAIIYLR